MSLPVFLWPVLYMPYYLIFRNLFWHIHTTRSWIHLLYAFIIPGFPFITSGIDLAKLDLRSGLERLAYAIIIILAATLTAWICALVLHLQPVDFVKLHIPTSTKLL